MQKLNILDWRIIIIILILILTYSLSQISFKKTSQSILILAEPQKINQIGSVIQAKSVEYVILVDNAARQNPTIITVDKIHEVDLEKNKVWVLVFKGRIAPKLKTAKRYHVSPSLNDDEIIGLLKGYNHFWR